MIEGQLASVEAEYDRRSDEWAVRYDGGRYADHLLRQRKEIALGIIRRRATTRGHAVDVGCGAGQLLAELHAAGWAVAGCDIAVRQCAATNRRLRTAAAARGDGTRLPFASNGADVVVALGYLEYQTDLDVALAELARVTRPGGLLVVSAPNRLRMSYVLDPIGVLRGRRRPTHRGHRRRYLTARGLHRALDAAHVHDIEVLDHGYGRFTVGGRPIISEARAIAWDQHLARLHPSRGPLHVGADLVAAGTVAR